jgi:phosphoglycerate kinase
MRRSRRSPIIDIQPEQTGENRMSFKSLDDIGDVTGKRVLVREDLNVPMDGGQVTDDTRLRAAAPTIAELADKGAIVLILAHFGRPKGERNPEMSLAMVTKPLESVLGRECASSATAQGDRPKPRSRRSSRATIACSKIRASTRAKKRTIPNSPRRWRSSAISMSTTPSRRRTARMLDRRARPSAAGLAGRSMEAELEALEKALGNPEHPVAAVVGGAKVSSKLDVLKHLVAKVDHLIIGGGMANTFLAARGVDVGKSLCEHDLKDTVLEILDAAEKADCTVHLPYDVVVAKEFRANPPSAPSMCTRSPPTR